MEARQIDALLLTPACFSGQPAMGNETETLPYIPGTTLRGMLASLYLGNASSDDTFRQIFCSDKVLFPNLYPAGAQPLPRSAYTCKHAHGFRGDPPHTGAPHGVFDLLFEGQAGGAQRICPRCEGPLTPLAGDFCTADPARPTRVHPGSLQRMRTAVSPETGSAQQGTLRSDTELPAGLVLQGMLKATDGVLLHHLQTRLGDSVTGWAGRKRAGKLDVRFHPAPATTEPDFLPWPLRPGERFFALTLTSDALLVDRLLRPITTLTSSVVYEFLAFPEKAPLEVLAAFRAVRWVSGWNSVGRIFKPDEIALAAGSAFLLRTAEETKSDVLKWMAMLEASGIGLRRGEGFGQVAFNQPFHRAAARNGAEGHGGRGL